MHRVFTAGLVDDCLRGAGGSAQREPRVCRCPLSDSLDREGPGSAFNRRWKPGRRVTKLRPLLSIRRLSQRTRRRRSGYVRLTAQLLPPSSDVQLPAPGAVPAHPSTLIRGQLTIGSVLNNPAQGTMPPA
jgi:hypothetical protein